MKKMNLRGFTLIELLIVIAIIAIIASVAFVALDPLTRFRDARDSSRWSDIAATMTAIKVDQVDNGGAYLTTITDDMTAGVDYMVGTASTGCNVTCTDVSGIAIGGCIDLTGLVTEGYLGAVPISPNGTGSWDATLTGYAIEKSSTGSITIQACESENSDPIYVLR
jgi:prepilin-type N-terminal cleavage/methylation domain-containing protein